MASLARLVRGERCRCAERTIVVSVLVMCMLVWCWSGQEDAGLEALRSPAVRNLAKIVVLPGVAAGLPGVSVIAHLLERVRPWKWSRVVLLL